MQTSITKSSRNQSDGTKELIYVAFGYEYLLMAAHSANTAKENTPGCCCTVVTNLSVRIDDNIRSYFDRIIELDKASEDNREVKTQAIHYANCDKAVYLDCDTEVCGDLTPMFICLDRFDVILKQQYGSSSKQYDVGPGVPSHLFPYWNGGVVFFNKNERSTRFFDEWHRLFREMGGRSDQPSLVRTVYENADVRLLSVGSVWNTFKSDLPQLEKQGVEIKSRIWHYRDANAYPDVAQKILHIHEDIFDSIRFNKEQSRVDAEHVVFRYRVLASKWYSNPVVRPLFLRLLRLCERMSWLPRFDQVRVKRKKGERFQRIDNSMSG